jgi:hypothetical protein
VPGLYEPATADPAVAMPLIDPAGNLVDEDAYLNVYRAVYLGLRFAEAAARVIDTATALRKHRITQNVIMEIDKVYRARFPESFPK